MGRLPDVVTGVLAPALTAARSALAALEPDDVPHKLRPVAAASGKRLPPPLAEQLLTALDDHEWLREAALEHLGDTHEASAAFLRRDSGWWAVLVEAAKTAATRALERDLAAARSKTDRLSARYDVARRKAKDAADETEAVRRAAQAEIAEVRRQAAALGQGPQSGDDELASLEAALADALDRVRVADAEAAGLADKLRRERRRRAEAERTADRGGRAVVRDPIGLARHLDALVEVAARARPGGTDVEAGEAPLSLPVGVRPDSGAAVRVVLDDPLGFTLVLDGHNVAGALPGNRLGDPAVRGRINAAAAQAVRQARGAVRAIVVYDSGVEGDRTDTPHADRAAGVVVRFAPAGVAADDVVVETAHEARRAVVVSNDRDVRERAEAAGALALWATAFVEWMA